MAASSGGAVKAYIESRGLGLAVYRDRPPDQTPLPYVTVHEDIALVNHPTASTPFDPSVAQVVVETVQVDLWQVWKSTATNALTESYTLGDALARALNGALLPAAPTRVWGVILTNKLRILDKDENIVQTALTVTITRDL